MAWQMPGNAGCGQGGCDGQHQRDEVGAVVRLSRDGYRRESAETTEGRTCGRFSNRACQLASSWSRDDHEDGGPTIQLPAADARCTLRSPSFDQYTRLRPAEGTGDLGAEQLSRAIHCALKLLQWRRVAVIDVHSFGSRYSGAQRAAVREVSFTVGTARDLRIPWPKRRGQEHDPERPDPIARRLRRPHPCARPRSARVEQELQLPIPPLTPGPPSRRGRSSADTAAVVCACTSNQYSGAPAAPTRSITIKSVSRTLDRGYRRRPAATARQADEPAVFRASS